MQAELRAAVLMPDVKTAADERSGEEPGSMDDEPTGSPSALSSKPVVRPASVVHRKKERKDEDDEKDYAQRDLFETEVVQRELCGAAVAVYKDGSSRVDDHVLGKAVVAGTHHNDSVR
jgi:hypothetical protein